MAGAHNSTDENTTAKGMEFDGVIDLICIFRRGLLRPPEAALTVIRPEFRPRPWSKPLAFVIKWTLEWDEEGDRTDLRMRFVEFNSPAQPTLCRTMTTILQWRDFDTCYSFKRVHPYSECAKRGKLIAFQPDRVTWSLKRTTSTAGQYSIRILKAPHTTGYSFNQQRYWRSSLNQVVLNSNEWLLSNI